MNIDQAIANRVYTEAQAMIETLRLQLYTENLDGKPTLVVVLSAAHHGAVVEIARAQGSFADLGITPAPEGYYSIFARAHRPWPDPSQKT